MRLSVLILIFIIACVGNAQLMKPDVQVNKILRSEDISFLSKLFGQVKVLDSMECEIKAKLKKSFKKFKDKSVTTETLELIYRPNGYDPEEKIVISSGNIYGNRVTFSLEEGQIEEFKIEFDDYYGSFIKFSHDGNGHLTGFTLFDYNRVVPCQISRY